MLLPSLLRCQLCRRCPNQRTKWITSLLFCRNASTEDNSAVVSVIYPGNDITASTVILTTGGSQYLFNCPEGFQRVIMESSVGRTPRNFNHILLTRTDWRNTGGFISFILMMIGSTKSIHFHGPSADDLVLSSQRDFISAALDQNFGRFIKLFSKHTTTRDTFVDINGTVIEYYPLYDAKSRNIDIAPEDRDVMKLLKDNDPYWEVTSYQFQREQYALGLKKKKNSSEPPSSLAYLVTPTRNSQVSKVGDPFQTGAWTLEAVNKGPTSALHAQVEDEVHGNGSILILEVNGEKELSCLNLTDSQIDNISVVVHMTTEDVFQSAYYAGWLEKFPSSTRHLLLNSSCNQVDSMQRHYVQWKLNLLDQLTYPVIAVDPNDAENTANGSNIIRGASGVEISSADNPVISRLSIHPYKDKMESAQKQFMDGLRPEQLRDFETAKQIIADYRATGLKEFPQVVMLGTGSAMVSALKNPTSVLVRLSEDKCVMMDCGDGTAGQLRQLYGDDEAARILTTLGAVLVTHRHGDHHLGLLGVIFAREWAFKRLELPYERLVVLAPKYQIPRMLNNYSRERRLLTDLIRFKETVHFKVPNINRSWVKAVGLRSLQAVSVQHVTYSFGYVLGCIGGEKIVFSGDTRPISSLAEAGMGADLLIHEARYKNNQAHIAVKTLHSTIHEAISAGENMDANNTLLTHLGEPNMVFIHDDAPPNVIAAVDFMVIRLSELPLLCQVRRVFEFCLSEFKGFRQSEFPRKEISKSRCRQNIAMTIAKLNSQKEMQWESEVEQQAARKKNMKDKEFTQLRALVKRIVN